ncbi:hypothetical protein PHLGIDRAFT_261535 [Phlebiopsis gigantea 11061_1 CR5-6]|uniref:DNA replication regulator SLD2 n=1 Tax=Phlebiopsis gigantea (strain 11061_1 CR5-6) TaxID=745531 RepID=A0A0C3PWW9_PHLG1|nr:hypothetical protein PHLGIDRAFT_261535 [Phlebiopsis gigantea 11061_1 CR5-6]
MDVSALRLDIKSWEKRFRQQHGRDPTVQEIKDVPDLADKYKLYKKLSKQPQPARPSPPPQDVPRLSSSALSSTSKSRPRAVKTEPSASTSNPFSPVKNKHGKQREPPPASDALPITSLLSSVSRANPFTTPTKPKNRGARRAPVSPLHELDEDPFPLIDQPSQAKTTHPSSSSHTGQPPAASFYMDATEHPPPAIAAVKSKDAVSRARKRLRGELVSPSPVKEKRPRVAERLPVQAALTFNNADSSDEDGAGNRGVDTFITDTPAKPPTGKKQFKVLFDEAVLPASQPLPAAARPKDFALTRSKSVNGKGLFGFGLSAKEDGAKERSQAKSRGGPSSPSHSDDDMDWDLPTKAPSTRIRAPDFSPSTAKLTANTKAGNSGTKLPKGILPGKDNLRANPPKDAAQSSSKKRPPSPTVQPSTSRSTPNAGLSALPLLPPSPPAEEYGNSRYGAKAKGKGPVRKKTKTEVEDEDEDSSDESDGADVKVKEMPWRWERHNSHSRIELIPGQDQQHDSEPEFDVGVYRPFAPPELPANAERFEVDLPEDLRRVLALSPPRHAALDPGEEEKLVHRLLYGRREGHYEASRGGEIWGVGEVDGESENEDVLGLGKERVKSQEEDEDEWEGEPVPWEVGEL